MHPDAAKSLALEVWSPRHVAPWGNLGAGAVAPVVLVPDETSQHRAPRDVLVNGRFESWPLGKSPVLVPGDVLANVGSEDVFRVPTALKPEWKLERCPDLERSVFLSRLESEARRAGWDLSQPEARTLLGAARADALGALRGRWERGFLIEARWAPAATIPASMAWHLWQVLTSPAGFALERFAGTPRDADDAEAVREVIREFPAPRLKLVTLEGIERSAARRIADVEVQSAPLPWLEVRGSPLPEGVRLAGTSNRPRLAWQPTATSVRLNGHAADDRCVWSEPLWVELRADDSVEVGTSRLTIVATR